jgi:hypothetical protein
VGGIALGYTCPGQVEGAPIPGENLVEDLKSSRFAQCIGIAHLDFECELPQPFKIFDLNLSNPHFREIHPPTSLAAGFKSPGNAGGIDLLADSSERSA